MMEKESSLAVKAYETIRQQIFDFDLFPGQIVSDYLLSKELNMSRTPIRQEELPHFNHNNRGYTGSL